MTNLKQKAAEKAVEYIRSGMVLGLGTGSTTYYALVKIAELIKNGTLENIVGIPSSKQTEQQAIELGIPLTTLDDHPFIDLTIDGADEIDLNLNLIKGGGGALLREKVIAQATKTQIIIADETKYSQFLGEKWHIPIEVLPFAVHSELIYLESLGAVAKLRLVDGKPFITDNNNYIVDANFGKIDKPQLIASLLERRAGIIEHGLFVDLTDIAVIASEVDINVIEL